MDNEALIAAIDSAEQSSYSSEGDTLLSNDRAYAIEMYAGKNLEPAPEGRSQVIDRSVFETIQWILPSLCRIFANGDDVVEIAPIGPEDEAQAKQESQYLNHVILQKNNWFETFITWATDAMLVKNGYALAYNEERTNGDIDRYERQTEQGVLMLQQDKDVAVEVLNQYPDPDYVEPPPQQVMDPMTGQPVLMPPPPAPMLYDVQVTQTAKERKTCIKVLPPERCKVSYRTPSFRLTQECPYFEYYDYKTLSDLRAEGFDVPDEIPDDWDVNEQEELARDNYSEQSWRTDNNEPDPSMRRYRVRMIWILHDDNEDGIAERMYVVRIGRQILHKEQVSRIPVASLVAIPNGHRHVATSVADIVLDIQRIKTAILRQGLDNLYLANNPRTFVTDKINLDDALVSRPGGVVRGENGAVFGQDIAPLASPFVFPQAMEGLEYMDQVRENRTGTNRYFTGIDQNAMNKTATGVQQLTTMAAQRVEQIARIMSVGVQDLFSIVHELILKSGHKKDVIKLSNQWVEVDPSQWKKRTDFRMAVGYAAGNKDALLAKLGMIHNQQMEAIQLGLPHVSPENIYETALEMVKASDFSAPTRFFTNPKEAPPKPPPQPDPTVMAVEQLKAQSNEKTTAATLMQADKEAQLKAGVDKYKAEIASQTQILVKKMDNEHAAAMEDFKLAGQAGLEHVKAQVSPKTKENAIKETEGKKKDEVVSKIMDTNTKSLEAIHEMLEKVSEAVASLNKPKKVIRDKNGRVESVVAADD